MSHKDPKIKPHVLISLKKRILPNFSISPQLPTYFPRCTEASAFRGVQCAPVSNHLIRSPHLVAPPDKSTPYPLQSKLTGMRARNSEHARFWLLDWCVCGYTDPPSHTRWIHTLEQPIPTWEMPAQSIHRSGPINHKSSLKLNWSKISYISSEL